MATAGSAKCTGRPGQKCQRSSADPLRSASGPHPPPRSPDEARCPVCSEAVPEPVPMPCGHSVCLRCFQRTVECGSPRCCPLCRLRVSNRARRRSGGEAGPGSTELGEQGRLSRPERSSRRLEQRDCDTRKDIFISPAQISKCGEILSEQTGKQKVLMTEEKDDGRRRIIQQLKEECGSNRHHEDPAQGVLSDSENEEPIGRRTRNVSAFVRKTKSSSAFRDGVQRSVQRSQSCTESVEGRGKRRLLTQTSMMDMAGIGHSSTAGILLSSENSRSVSAPVGASDRRLTWRSVMTSSTPLGIPQAKQERSISPESNDSISEELNHFKPIVCSPCTPPKRLPDGRLLEPTIVKSTPRNLTRGLQRATSYEASPAVLQKWRQIELDRQSVKVTKGTLTSPVNEHHVRTTSTEEREARPCGCTENGKEDVGVCVAKKRSAADRESDRVVTLNKRRLVFDQSAGETERCQKQSIKIHVPARRYNSEGPLRGSSDFDQTVVAPESCSGALFSKKQSFSPYARNSSFQSCKRVSKDQHSPRKEADSSSCNQNQSTSRRGKKRSQKTKHLEDRESEQKRARPVSQEAFDKEYRENHRYFAQIQQEREDRALALKLQTQFDLESQRLNRQRWSPERYFLRSWMSNQNRRRRSPRKSRRISKKH
ncbi:E3 ubiquitin-protein ligase RNF169 [Polymixia lowei]